MAWQVLITDSALADLRAAFRAFRLFRGSNFCFARLAVCERYRDVLNYRLMSRRQEHIWLWNKRVSPAPERGTLSQGVDPSSDPYQAGHTRVNQGGSRS